MRIPESRDHCSEVSAIARSEMSRSRIPRFRDNRKVLKRNNVEGP